MLQALNGLTLAGCDVIVMPCNTVHYFYDFLTTKLNVPILHIVDSVIEELKNLKISPGKVGLISTYTTRDFKIYDKRMNSLGWEIIYPSEYEIKELVMPAISSVKGNDVISSYKPFLQVANSQLSRGAKIIILGCTEIQIGLNAGPITENQLPLIDSVDCLARYSIAWYRNFQAIK